MADEGYPFPGTSQITTADEWEAFFSAVQLDGVVSGLAPSINSGARTASVGSGSAYLRGYLKPVSSTTATAVPAAAGQDRVDRLVLRLDRDAANTASYIVPTVLTGTAGTSTPPSLTRGTTGAWDLPISRWTSKSDGSLTGLVDERYGPTWFTSAARTASLIPAEPPRAALETDTGEVYRSNGFTWQSIYEDTGWLALPIANLANWSDHGQRCRRRNGVVYFELNVRREGSDLATNSSDAAQGSHIATLPAGLRPSQTIAFPTTLTAGISARLRVYTGGEIYLQAPSHTVGVGRYLRHAASFPVG